MATTPKDVFRSCVMSGMESLMTLADNIWEYGYPSIRIKLRNGEVVVVGIEEIEDANDDSDGDQA